MATIENNDIQLPHDDYILDRAHKKSGAARVDVISYSLKELLDGRPKNISEIMKYISDDRITWINIVGINDSALMRGIGENFHIHPLALEDIMNQNQRPILEDYDRYLQIVLKYCDYDEEKKEIKIEQVSMLVGSNWVISFQEKTHKIFESIIKRIKTGKGRIRKLGSDYLAYAILDCVVDYYFVLLEKIGEDIEETEDKITEKTRPEIIQDIFLLRRELVYLRRSVWPLRDIINNLYKTDSKLFKKPTDVFIRDLYDHTIQVMDTIETYRDLVAGMTELHMSSISNRMNEIMKVLTIVSTIFAPLTFVVGVYGMNLYMPEAKWGGTYFAIWGIMSVIALSMIFFFKKRRWF
jgi:magnesium transporter